MAAPRGDYTPKSGPLAGQTFRMQPGDKPTSPYNRYQNARAQALGYQSYPKQRAVEQGSRLATDKNYQTFQRRAVFEGKNQQWARQKYLEAQRAQKSRLNQQQMRRLQVQEGLAENEQDTWYH